MAVYRFFAACVPIVLCLAHASRALGDDDVELLISGTRQAREAIRTLSLEFEMRPRNRGKPGAPTHLGEADQRVKWIQSDKTARWKFSSDFGNIQNEYLWKDDKLKLISSSGSGSQEVSSGVLAPQPKLESQTTSPWLYALFVSLERPHDPIDVALANQQYQIGVVEVQREGRKEKHVTFVEKKSGAIKKELWIAPELNYLVTKSVGRQSADGSTRLERLASEFKEIKPGLFFPSRGEARAFRQGIQFLTISIEFKNIHINDPVDPADLELRFPAGLPIADSISNTYYTLDQAEKPVPGSSELIAVSKDEQLRFEALRPWYHRWQPWVWMGLALATIGILGALWRTRRNKGKIKGVRSL